MQCIGFAHSIRVVIADRHPVVLEGLMSILCASTGFEVVASCGEGTSCIEAIRRLIPDIAIFDISMPGRSGMDIMAMAKSENLPTRLVCFTEYIEHCDMLAAAGAYGLIAKDVTSEILVQSLRQIAEGRRLLPLAS